MRKIAVFGPPLSGKATILQSAARTYDLKLGTFEVENPDITIPNRAIVAHGEASGAAIELVTMSGAVWHPKAWELLLRGSEVLLVFDGQDSRLFENLEVCLQLAIWQQPVSVKAVQITKCDIAEDPAIREIDGNCRAYEVPVFRSQLD